MDRKFRPAIRKISIDKIHIPFYMNFTDILVELLKVMEISLHFRYSLQKIYGRIQ